MLLLLALAMLMSGISGCAFAPVNDGASGAAEVVSLGDGSADVGDAADTATAVDIGASSEADAVDATADIDAADAAPVGTTASRKASLRAQIDAFEAATAAMAQKYDYVEDPSDEATMLRTQLESALEDADIDEVGAQLSRAVSYVRGALYVIYDGISKPGDGGDTTQIEADMAAYEEAMAGIE